MKLKLNLKAIGLSTIAAMVLIAVLAIIEVIFGWGVIWGCFAILLYPLAEQIITIWKENGCRTFDDLVDALKSPEEEPGDLQTVSSYPYY